MVEHLVESDAEEDDIELKHTDRYLVCSAPQLKHTIHAQGAGQESLVSLLTPFHLMR